MMILQLGHVSACHFLCLVLLLSLCGSPATDALQCQQQRLSRRACLSGIGFAATIATVTNAKEEDSQQFATSAGRKGCETMSDPARTVVTCTGDLSVDQVRLSGIAATANGVSTSAVKNPSRFSPPWTYLTETDDAIRAWKSLQAAIQKVCEKEDLQILAVTDSYLYATVRTAQPPGLTVDDLEFVLRPIDKVVLYRSASRSSVFIYPLTQPVSDRNSNLQRLQKIRSVLEWEELGYPQQGSQRL
jgi:uncharacterized protein (DUF1499 family)